jgi:hypothetical protein
MPARSHVPKYCFHSARGLAYVRIADKVRYLGKHNSPESLELYRRILAEMAASPVSATPAAGSALPKAAELTVMELAAAYLDYAEAYYVKEGKPTAQVKCIHRAIWIVKELYSQAPARPPPFRNT